MKISTFAM